MNKYRIVRMRGSAVWKLQYKESLFGYDNLVEINFRSKNDALSFLAEGYEMNGSTKIEIIDGK